MNLSDGPLFLFASLSLLSSGVALGVWFERNRPDGTLDLREQRDKARKVAGLLRHAKTPRQQPAFAASDEQPGGNLRVVPAAGGTLHIIKGGA